MDSPAPSFDRRTFLKTASAAGIGIWASHHAVPLYGYTGSPNQKVVVAVMGVNSRGDELAKVFAGTANAEVAYICDVDERAVAKTVANTEQVQGGAPRGVVDFRRVLEDPAVDALVIAAPDHWHAPAAILALQAGKHVYVEKPCGHNPHEGELLVEAQRKYDRLVQMGNQQRSSPESIEIVEEIRNGLIGRAYYARAWYANNRDTIGRGMIAPRPEWLNYELWQGPAPRTPYQDNVVHYNWHWFWRWGTGEICNNGTHEIDICRWALGVEYPTRVSSSGGRYHFQDDWEFPDTQEVSFEFEDDKMIVWHGRSCNGFPLGGSGRGASIHGTEGTVVVDRNGYMVYDLANNLIRERRQEAEGSGLDIRGADRLTSLHVANFVNAIRDGAQLHASIEGGHKSTLLCHLGNIAQHVGRSLRTEPSSGRIVDDDEATKLWRREYEPGWEPVV